MVAANDLGATRHFLEATADPNASLAKDGSALSIAVERGSARMLELFLTKGGDPNLRAPGTDPLLHIATLSQRKDEINVLLEHGADINAVRERDRSTAATLAVVAGRFDLAVYFVERGLSADLQQLAASAATRAAPESTDQQRWKANLIAVLKDRGVKVPEDPR